MLDIFNALKEFLKDNKVKKLFYKAIPHIYHIIPAEEDLYALFVNDAKLVRRDVSSTIFLEERVGYSKGRRWGVNRSKRNGLYLKRDYDFETFMIFNKKELKKKYGLEPVHTPEEMDSLANKFPDNIKLYTVQKNNEMVAGVIMYESKNVAHGQYWASSNNGKKMYASDFLWNFLIRDRYKDKKYFDFGISTEENGLYLNKDLIKYKEEFNARTITHDFYEMNISN